MRILHTADWHIGRRLGRHDRTEEMRDALDEVARIADEEQVDLVLVAGDVFDRATPPGRVAVARLDRLASPRPRAAGGGRRRQPRRAELFDALAPLLRDRGVHLIGRIRAPNAGGVLGPDELGVPSVVAGFPFLREGRRDRLHGRDRHLVRHVRPADRGPHRRVQHGARGTRGHRPGPDPGRALHGERRAGLAQRARAPHRRRVHRDRAGDPCGTAVRRASAISTRRNPSRALRFRRPTLVRWLAMDFGEAGETKRVVIVEPSRAGSPRLRSVPIEAGAPA
jgi:hypothetical protein